MKKLMQHAVLATVAISLASAPAMADKYVFYGNSNHHGYDDRRHEYKHHGRGHGYGHGHGKWRDWDDRRVTIYSAPSYRTTVIRPVRYVEPAATYSEIRCTNSYNPLGPILGGAAGGIIGNSIGKGKGRTAAIITGAVLGSAVGHGMVSQRCSEQVFQQVPVGTPVSWQDASAGEYYNVVPTRDYRTEGRYCREYQATARVGGNTRETYGTACMQPDGSWEIVN